MLCDGAGSKEEVRSTLLVLCDPVLAAIMDDSPIADPQDWLAEKCRELGVPVPVDGDFPFSEGVQQLDENGRVFLTRLESLHLLASGKEWLSHLPDESAITARISAARFENHTVRRLYKSPLLKRLYRPIHRTMMRRKWTAEPRAHLPGDEIIVYHHVPKCAGMSVFHHLNEFLKWNDELVHLDGRANEAVNAHGLVPFAHKDPRELDRIEVLFGHEVSLGDLKRFPMRTPLFVTCLRDPASRMVSHYNWEMHQLDERGARISGFEEWVSRQDRNWMTQWLAREFFEIDTRMLSDEEVLAAVNKGLGKFWMVCSLETFPSQMRHLTDKLGLPPIDAASNRAGESYPRRQELTPGWTERIEAEHPLDVALYRRWTDIA